MSEICMSEICIQCGKKIIHHYGFPTRICSRECMEKFDHRKQLDVLSCQYKKQEFEEIKQMAWKIFLKWNTLKEPYLNPASAWENAKDFYDFMKEQEQATEQEKTQ